MMKADRSQKTIIIIALISEVTLAAIYCVCAFFRENLQFTLPFFRDIFIGVIAVVPLLIVNFTLLHCAKKGFAYLSQFREFASEIVAPFAASLSFGSIVFVSLLAGIGEELFFRGVLQVEFGVLFSSVIFSLLHFGSALKKYPLVAFVYFLVGIYFAHLYSFSQTLWTPTITHIIYDIAALILVARYQI